MIKLAAAAATAVLLVATSACSSEPKITAPAAEPPVSGGVLRQGLVRVSSIDPAQATTISERVLADQLYDGLTTWDSLTGEVRPVLATRWESANANKSWTFFLRPDVKAANGEVITASDVKTSLEHLVRPSSPSSDLLTPVVGYQPFAENPAEPGMAGITTPDAITVKIELASPLAELPSLLGNPAFGIKHFATNGSGAITTGPMTPSKSEGDKTLSLVKAGGRDVYLDGIETTFYPDLEAAYAAFDAGLLDWVPVAPGRAVEAARKFGGHLYRPSLRSLSLSINTQNPKFGDRRFREAVIRGIDRSALVRLTEGDVRPLSSINTDAVPGDQRSLCGVACSFDPQASRALVASLFPGATPPPVIIDVVGDAPFGENLRTRIVGDLAAVGIKAEVRSAQLDQFGSVTVTSERELLQTGWSAAYPSAEASLPALFISSSRANVSGFRDAAIDQRILDAQSDGDVLRRNKAYAAIETDILSLVPVIPLMQFPVASVARPNVRGLAAQSTGNFDAAVVWIAPAA